MSATSRSRTRRSSASEGPARSTAGRGGRGRTSPKTRPRDPSETRVARWLRLRGYRVLDANVWLAGAELDLVVRRGSVLAFVEVKSKSGMGFGDPLDMVSPLKVARIRRAAAAWLALHPGFVGLDLRFDVVAVRAGRIEHLRGAF